LGKFIDTLQTNVDTTITAMLEGQTLTVGKDAQKAYLRLLMIAAILV